MRVLIDGSIYSSAPSGGIFKYFNEILPRLSKVAGTSVVVLTPKGATAPPSAPGIEIQASNLGLGRFFPSGSWRKHLSPLKRGLENTLVRFRNQSAEPSLFHSAYYSLSPVPKIPQLLTVYDAISEVVPEFTALPFHQEMTRLKERSLPHADRLLAISQKTKDDICAHFGISPERVDVTPLGIDAGFYAERSAPTGKLSSLPGRYLLYVGGRLNHKNFPRFAEAYAVSHLRNEIPVLVAGTEWTPEEKAYLTKLGVASQFQLIRNPSDEEVRTLYQRAQGFVYPSLYEGFGMPLLEAFASGTAVATARAGSLPEVAGDAALYFDPRDPSDIARALENLLDPKTAQSLIAKGKARLCAYSWDQTAALTHAAYLKTL